MQTRLLPFPVALAMLCLVLPAPASAAKLDVTVICNHCTIEGEKNGNFTLMLDQATGEIWAHPEPFGSAPPSRVAKLKEPGAQIQPDPRYAEKQAADARELVAKQAADALLNEAKLNLMGVFTAEKAFFGEYNTYATDLLSVNWMPDGRPRYVYGFCNAFPASVPGIPSYDPKKNNTSIQAVVGDPVRFDDSTARKLGKDPCALLEKLGHAGRFEVTATGFRAFAIGNLDGDADLDVWSVDQNRVVVHERKD